MKILFVGMLPQDSHNPEERLFVGELRKHVDDVLYARGVGIKGFSSRQLRSVAMRFRSFERTHESRNIFRLLVVPPRGLLGVLNSRWLEVQLRDLVGHHPGEWTFWTRFPSPELVDAVDRIGFARIVYEPIDQYEASLDFTERERWRIYQAEQRLVRRATVIAGARVIADRFSGAGGGSAWLPFGLDYPLPQPPHMEDGFAARRSESVTVGVVAEFDWRVDEGILANLAKARPHWSIQLVGPRSKNWGKSLGRLRNVRLEGRVSPELARNYVRQWDAALIPYVMNDWTLACLPVKVFEYLAEGRPVISTELPELEPFADVVERASSAQFVAAVSQAIAADSVDAQRRRIAASQRFTLQARAEKAVALLSGESQAVAVT